MEDLKKDVSTISNYFIQLEKDAAKAKEEAKLMGGAFGWTLKTVKNLFSPQKIKEFGEEMVSVRSQFQLLELNLERVIGNKEKADQVMKEVVDMAAWAPFDVETLANATTQLLQYGSEAGSVTETLSQLGDIAVGLSAPLGTVVDMYGKVQQQGILNKETLMEFTAAGIPMVQALADQFGVATSQVSLLAEEGRIGFDDVNKAIANMTGQGGSFYGEMDKQSQTLRGQIDNLKDAWKEMLNAAGKESEGMLSMGIGAATKLIQNYETIGKVLAVIAASYGVGRAALVIYDLVKAGDIALDLVKLAITEKLNIAMKKLNLTMLTNPVFLIAAGVTALIGTMIALASSTNKADKALHQFNENKKKFKEEQAQSQQGAEQQLGIIQNENETDLAKQKAYEELKKNSPKLAEMYSLEALKTLELKEAQRLLNEERDRAEEQDFIKNIEKHTEQLKKYKEEHGKVVGSSASGYTSTIDYSKQIKETQELLDQYKIKYREFQKMQEQGLPLQVKLDSAKENLKRMEGELEDLKQQIDNSGMSDIPVELQVQLSFKEEAIRKLLDLIGKLEKGIGADQSGNKDKAYWEKQKSEAEKTLHKMGSSEKDSQKWKDQVKLIREAQREINKYSVSFSETKVDIEKETEKMNDYILSTTAKLETERNALLEDGLNKRLEQSRLEYEEKQHTLDKEYEGKKAEYSKLGLDIPAGLEQNYTARSSANQESWEKRDTKLHEEVVAEKKQHEASLTAYLLTAEEKRLEAIKKRYDTERGWAQKQLAGGNMTQAEFDTYSGSIDMAESGENLQYMIQEYKTYTDQRQEIETKFRSHIATMEAQNEGGKYDENIRLATEQQNQALAAVDKKIAEKEGAFSGFMEKMANMGIKELRIALEKAQDALNKDTSGDDKEKAVMRAKVYALQEKLKLEEGKENSLSPADKSIRNWKNVQTVMGETSKTIKGIVSSFEGMDEATKASLSAAENIATGTIAMIVSIQALSKGAAEGMKTVERASVILAIIGAAVQILTAIFSMGAKADKEHQQALKNIAQEKIKMQREYNKLLLEQKLLMKEATSVFGTDQISKAANSIDVYRDAVQQYKDTLRGEVPKKSMAERMFGFESAEYKQNMENYKKGIGALGQLDIVTGSKKKGALFWKRQKDVYSSVLSVYPDLIDGENNLNVERAKAILSTHKMSDANKALLQDLIGLQEMAEKAQAELRSYLEETFGSLGDGIMTSLTDAIQNGTDAWKAFGDAGATVLENLGRQIAYTLFFSDKFKKLQADLETIYGSGKSDETIARESMALVGEFYNGIGNDMERAQAWMEGWQAEAAKSGFNLWAGGEESGQETSTKGFAAMSQETGDELNGRFTSLQMSGINLEQYALSRNQMLGDISFDTSAINTNVGLIGMSVDEIRDINRQSMNHLYKIEKNTALLNSTNELLGKVVANTANL